MECGGLFIFGMILGLGFGILIVMWVVDHYLIEYK